MIIFNEAQTLSYSTNFNYLGDAFNYNNSSTLKIKGRFQSDSASESEVNSFFGVAYVEDGGIWYPVDYPSGIETETTQTHSGNLYFEGGSAYVSTEITGDFPDYARGLSPLYDIWDEMESIKSRFSDFQEIYLNGVSVGSGRVNSITFPESPDARVATYEAELQIFKTGDLSNLTGQNYQNISIDPDFCKNLSSFGESFDISTDLDGVLSYKRSLDFDCINPNYSDSEFLNSVKAFASGVIFNDPAFQASLSSYPDFYEQEGSRYFTESYDNIKGAYSFNESFQGPTSGENYRWSHGLSVSLESDGVSSVSEKGTVIGVRDNILNAAKAGMTEIESSSLGRATSFYGFYNGQDGPCDSGIFLKSKNRLINEAAGTIDYTFNYSNDFFSNTCYGVTQEIESSISDGGVFSITEKGSVKNLCEPTNSGKLTKSIEYFNNSISGDVLSRLSEYYQSQFSGCGCDGSPVAEDLRKVSSDFDYSEFDGVFGYSYLFRNDCTSIHEDTFIIEKESSVSDTIHNVYLAVTPYNGELAQKQNASSLINSSQTISVTSMVTGKSMDDYLQAAINYVEAPSSKTFFMNSSNYDFNPDESKLTLEIGYSYTGYRQYTNYNV